MSRIEAIADEYLKGVRRSAGDEVSAVCPFHRRSDGSEGSASNFSLNLTNGLWCCHSCHARGNLYTFLRDVGVPQNDIRSRYGEALEEARTCSPADRTRRHYVEDGNPPLPESFLGFFDYCPTKLLNEGYPGALLREFDIGYDQVHERVTFPLRDRDGQLVGISGRAQHDGVEPRYKLYDREYLAFGFPPRAPVRRSLLWNFNRVRNNLAHVPPDERQALHFCVVVEGYKAALRVAQAGIPNVVGLLGSHMTDEQAAMLLGLGCRILLMLDHDDAGVRGTVRAGQLLTRSTTRCSVVLYNGSQPSEVPPSEIAGALAHPVHFSRWYIDNAHQRGSSM